eukprot:Skav210335  [mRNA]  locus=scaffold4443:88699:91857:- [translate_table: standard]
MSCPRKGCPGATYRESVSLGNCLNFCAEFSTALQLQDVPSWVGRLALAADFLLSPVLGILDSFNVLSYLDAAPAEAISADEDVRERQLAVTEAQCDVCDIALSSEHSPSAVENAVMLDFVEQFEWANAHMTSEHCDWEEQVEQKRIESLLAFL